MKILVLNYEFPPVGGGGGAVCRDICEQLAARGHRVVVQTAHWGDLPKLEDRDGYRIHRAFCFRRHAEKCSVPEMGFFLVGNLIPTLMRIRSFKPDLIHAHFAVPTGVLAWIARLLTGTPYALTLHLGDVPGAMPGRTDHLFRIVKPLAAPIWRGAAAITAVSDYVAGLGRRAYPVAVTTIPNGIRTPAEAPSFQIEEGPIRLLFAGRFDAQKNLLFLVEVLARLKHLNWSCTLLGDGPEFEAVKAAVNQHDLTQRVLMPGWVDRLDVEAHMRQSHALVMPSRFEGLPVVALTALNHGLALIGSDIGGFEGVIRHGFNGLCLPLHDAEGFAGPMGELLADRRTLTQMRQAAFEHSAYFALERVIDAYEAVFQGCVEPRG